jgi:hypothetical protein
LAVKYAARPRPSDVAEPDDMTSPDRLRKAMVDHLARAEARFDFMVQVRTSTDTMPIEDSSIVWSESESPFRRVASIVIPPQTFDTPQQMTFGENLSNTPWHSLPEHRPIGGINRVRKVVYQVISETRHNLNRAPNREPVPQTEP